MECMMVTRSSRSEVGQTGERLAAQFLQRKGYEILGTNYRKKWGEIDIIAAKGKTVHFVEVKAVSRESTSGEGSREMDYRPEELVHKTKLQKVARTAATYMEERGDAREYQIDVVGVIMNEKAHTARCRLFEQVIDGEIS